MIVFEHELRTLRQIAIRNKYLNNKNACLFFVGVQAGVCPSSLWRSRGVRLRLSRRGPRSLSELSEGASWLHTYRRRHWGVYIYFLFYSYILSSTLIYTFSLLLYIISLLLLYTFSFTFIYFFFYFYILSLLLLYNFSSTLIYTFYYSYIYFLFYSYI